MELYICDRARKIADGICSGVSCAMGDCKMTRDKDYAKKYITIYEAEELFKTMMESYIYRGEQEKAKQYANALKSVQEAIVELTLDSEKKESRFVDCLYEQLKLFEEVL